MERRLHSALYIVQISLLLLVGGCGGKKAVSPTPPPQKEGKMSVAIQNVYFVQSDGKGRKLLEIWADSSEGEEEKLALKGVRCRLYDRGSPFAELSAPSAIYQPKNGLLFFDKGAELRDFAKGRQIACNSMTVFFKERKIEGREVSLKWRDITLEGKEFIADWGLKKGMLKDKAMVKINMKRRKRR